MVGFPGTHFFDKKIIGSAFLLLIYSTVVSAHSDFAHMSGDIFDLHNSGSGLLAAIWPGTRDAVKHLTLHRAGHS